MSHDTVPEATKTVAEFSCPTPLPVKDTVLLGHGSGGKLSAELMRDVFLPALNNTVLALLDDQAIVNINGQRLALSTDSFVVKPLFFPGLTSAPLRSMARLTIWQWAERSRYF